NWWGNLWGRLYAGQRGQVQVAVSAPPPSAGITPAPQKEIPLHPAPAAGTNRWAQRVTQPVGPALCRPAGPGSSCRVGPTAVGRDEPGPTKRTSATPGARCRDRPLGSPAGQPVGSALCRPAELGSGCGIGPTAVGRDKPGPTKRTSASPRRPLPGTTSGPHKIPRTEPAPLADQSSCGLSTRPSGCWAKRPEVPWVWERLGQGQPPNSLRWYSRMVWISSSWVFITNGPLAATGSPIGLPCSTSTSITSPLSLCSGAGWSAFTSTITR